MAWVRFDPGFTRHRKRLEAGPLASWLWVCSIDYCVQHLTDGFVPESSVASLAPGIPNRSRGAAIQSLLDTGAWQRSGDGYRVHDFLTYQESADEVRRQREAGKQRAKRSREKRGGAVDRSPERGISVTPNVQRSAPPRHDAMQSCPVPPLQSPPPGDVRYDWPAADAKAASLRPGGTKWLPGRWPYDAFHHDCGDKAWRGKCVRQAYADEHPGQYPATMAGQPMQCHDHALGRPVRS